MRKASPGKREEPVKRIMNQFKTTAHELTSLLTRPSTSSEFLRILQDWLQPDQPDPTGVSQSGGGQKEGISREQGGRSLSTAFLKGFLHYLTASKGWLTLVTLTVVWGWWNDKVLLSTGGGLLTVVLVYRMQVWNWQRLKAECQRLWSHSNRQLTLAIVSGGLVSLGTYTAASIWADAESHWIAASLILQNGTLFAVLGLLIWYGIRHQGLQEGSDLDRLLADLTDPDPVKRLLAVRQITQLAANTQSGRPRPNVTDWEEPDALQGMTRSQIADCFRLMLGQEPELFVRNALLDGLQVLDDLPSLNPASSPRVSIHRARALASQTNTTDATPVVAYLENSSG